MSAPRAVVAATLLAWRGGWPCPLDERIIEAAWSALVTGSGVVVHWNRKYLEAQVETANSLVDFFRLGRRTLHPSSKSVRGLVQLGWWS